MREWEKTTWATGQTESAVISRVGQIVAERALRLTRPRDAILVLAGKGHNGDDARAARPHLADREVTLLDVKNPAAGLEEFRQVIAHRPNLIIDGLFGIGLNRPLAVNWTKLIELINQTDVPVLSIDVPSGLDADTGEAQGAAIRARVTLTLGTPKPGLLRSQASQFVGRLEVASKIGLVPCPYESELQWGLPDDFAAYPPQRRVDAHKGTFGHLTIFAGSLGYHGAAVLAARGALRAQPGLVTVFTPENVYLPVASQLGAAMVHPWHPGIRLPDSCSAVVFGPGLASLDLSADLKSETSHLWRELPLPVIADASALDWLPAGATRPGALRVITPHPGEAARMLKASVSDVQAVRAAALRDLARQFGDCWVVLKGHQTMIGRSAGEIFINPSGDPHLAQGGSGDVLAGYLGGLLAQPALQTAPLTALRYAVWQHGAAADELSVKGANWTIEELLAMLGQIAPAG